ncbi:MAG TPA: NADH-quinone oxidoreductase subunit L [Vicinamibacterales bacterium]|nr:NADH-quinone oxidoreductase subunit L [Vicinamibacterales bacterium]
MTTDPGTLALISLLLPAAAFLMLAIVAPLRRAGRPAAYLSVLFAAGSLASAVLAWRAHAEGVVTRLVWDWLPSNGTTLAHVGVLADADSTVMLTLVALVACLVQLYSLGYLHDEPPAALGRYYTYQSLFAFSMMGLVLAPNFLQLFICWELVGLCSYLLIGFWYQKPEAARAAVKAFWTTKAGDVGLLIGIVLLWRLSGTFDFMAMRAMVASGTLPVAGLSIITFCIYLGAMGKSAQFPLHVWLPDAMEGPTPVSALIHAATMVTAGVYLLHRTSWLFALTPDVLLIVAWIGAFTALLAAVLACVQDDIKRVLAYSTVSQLGYMMAAIGAGISAAGFLHLLTHGLFKALLFLGAGAVIHAVGSNDLPRMGGLAKSMPQTAAVFIIGTLSLAGIPFFAGFVSKEGVLGASLGAHQTGPFVLLMIVAFLTAFYMFRVVFLAFFATPAAQPSLVGAGFSRPEHAPPKGGPHDPRGPHDRHHEPHDPPMTMLLPLWILAALALVVGVYSTIAGHVPIVAGAGHETAPGWLTPAAIGVAIAGIALAWLTYQRRTIDAASLAAMFAPIRRAAIAKFWIDDLFEGVLGFALFAFSTFVGWVDRYLVDGVLNVVSAWTVSAGDDIRTIQTGRAQDYVYGVAVGLLLLMLWMRWALA